MFIYNNYYDNNDRITTTDYKWTYMVEAAVNVRDINILVTNKMFSLTTVFEETKHPNHSSCSPPMIECFQCCFS